MATITVNIDGKVYRMACEEGQEAYLTGLANCFDQHIMRLRKSFGEIGDLRLTVMAGITIMDELAELQKKIDVLEAENDMLRTARNQGVQERLSDMVTRVDVLSKKIASQIS